MAEKKWGFSKNDGPPWPIGDDGQPIPPAYLTYLKEVDFESQIIKSLLTSAGIPVVTQYPLGGEFGRVILGISGTGTELFVPETMLEDAKAMISGDFQEVEFEEDIQG